MQELKKKHVRIQANVCNARNKMLQERLVKREEKGEVKNEREKKNRNKINVHEQARDINYRS